MDILQFMSLALVNKPQVPVSVEMKDDTLDLKLGSIMADGLHITGVAEDEAELLPCSLDTG